DDWAVVERGGARLYNGGQAVEREIKQTALSGALIGKGNYRHFMLKEIHEQPAVVGDTLRAFLNPLARSVELPALPVDLAKVSKATIVACGTAFYAGMVGKYLLEQVARLPVELDIASEFRYRAAPMAEGGVTLVISQS